MPHVHLNLEDSVALGDLHKALWPELASIPSESEPQDLYKCQALCPVCWGLQALHTDISPVGKLNRLRLGIRALGGTSGKSLWKQVRFPGKVHDDRLTYFEVIILLLTKSPLFELQLAGGINKEAVLLELFFFLSSFYQSWNTEATLVPASPQLRFPTISKNG